MAKQNEFIVRFRLQDDGSIKQVGQQAEKTGKQVKKGVTQQAHSADRAMKGLSQQSSNATKNFSKMSQGLAGGIVPIYATLAAQIFAVSAAFQFLKNTADYRMLIEGQRAFGIATGTAYKSLAKIIGDATEGQITYAQASESAAIGIASGLSPGQLEKLATAAKRVSMALGRDLVDSFNRLVRGATKAEPELLDELGIVLRLDPALKKYADRIGKTKEQLTAFQRTQAVTNEILEQAETKYAAIEAIMDIQVNQINKANVAFDKMLNAFKLWLAGPVEKMANFFAKNMMAGVSIVILFAYSIIRNMLPSVKAWQAGLAEASIEHKAHVASMKQDLIDYQLALAAAQAQSRGSFAAGMGTQQGRAAGIDPRYYAAGGGMALLASGRDPSKRQLGALKGQLKRKVGPFSDKALGGDAKAAQKIRDQWDKTFKSMDKNIKGTGKTFKGTMAEMKLKSNVATGTVSKGWNAVKGVFMSVAKWGLKIFRVLTWFGIASIVLPPIYALAKGWLGVGEGINEANSDMQNFIIQQRMLNAEIEEFANESEKVMKMGYFAWLAQRGRGVGQLRMEEVYDTWLEARKKYQVETEKVMNKSTMTQFMAGKKLPPMRGLGWLNKIQQFIGKPIGERWSAELEEAVKAKDEFKELSLAMLDAFRVGTKLDKGFQDYYDTLRDGKDLNKEDLDAMNARVEIWRAGTNALAREQEQWEKVNQTRNKWQRPTADARSKYIIELDQMEKNLKAQLAMAEIAEKNKLTDEGIAELKERITENYKKQLEFVTLIADEERAIANLAAAKLRGEQIKGSIVGGTDFGKKQMTLQKINEGKATQLSLENKLKDHNLKLTKAMGGEELRLHLKEVTNLENSIALQKQKNRNLELSIDTIHEIGVAGLQAFDQGLQKGIMGVIDGTKTMKEAFLEMSKAVIAAIAQVIIKLIAMKAVEAMGFSFAGGGVIPKASGGYIGNKKPRGYRSGGIATEPTYLVGEGRYNEAVVPLPDGRSIPVQMKGGGSNVVVNVNVSSDGQTTSALESDQGQQAANLGRAISVAVTEEIYKQKRPGGALSPYG